MLSKKTYRVFPTGPEMSSQWGSPHCARLYHPKSKILNFHTYTKDCLTLESQNSTVHMLSQNNLSGIFWYFCANPFATSRPLHVKHQTLIEESRLHLWVKWFLLFFAQRTVSNTNERQFTARPQTNWWAPIACTFIDIKIEQIIVLANLKVSAIIFLK